ncbi:MAG: tyrosine-type recombinase/integrase [Acidobacteriota bacterium]
MKRCQICRSQSKNHSPWNVPFNSTALAVLKDQKTVVEHGPGGAVFSLPDPPANCRWWFLPALKAAKIASYTLHSNRLTLCSWLARAGRSMKDIQMLAGHKTITMAARYAHLLPDAATAA